MKAVEFGSLFDDQEARFAIFSTYEFDPIHFERYLLISKALARARRIIVMVDGSRFQRLLVEGKIAARSLNQNYLVLPVRRSGGVFHPKLALLLGEKHADLLCGSNNLTQSGSTHNLELLNRIEVMVDTDADEISHLSLVHQALLFFKTCLTHGEPGAGRIAEKWISELEQEFPWVNSFHRNESDAGLELLHTLNGGLWNRISTKIGDAKPRKIEIISPFYDADLGLLKRFRARWPQCPIEITAQQSTSNLPALDLAKMEKGIRLFDLHSADNRRLHAKLLAVDLDGRTLCIAGSANFTEAAFDGGNVEACLAWETNDKPVRGLFEDGFVRQPIKPSDFEPGVELPPSEDETPIPPIRVKSCALNENGRLSVSYSIATELKADAASIALKHYSEREPVFTAAVKVTDSGFEEVLLSPEVSGGFSGAVLCYLVVSKDGVLQTSVPMWLIQEHRLTRELSEGGGYSGKEVEVRETGRGLVEHLDAAGNEAELIRRLMELNIRFHDDGRRAWAGLRFRVKIRDPYHSDTIPDWMKCSREQFPELSEAIHGFADRHRDRVLRRHEQNANVNGLANFIDVMVANSGMLFVYLRRGILLQHQVTSRLREYLNIFTGKFTDDPDEQPSGYLARVFTNRQGELGLLRKTFEAQNVGGHIRALLIIAQIVRSGGCDPSSARCELPMLVDQISVFARRIGLGQATADQVRKALEDYEMLTDNELKVWLKATI